MKTAKIDWANIWITVERSFSNYIKDYDVGPTWEQQQRMIREAMPRSMRFNWKAIWSEFDREYEIHFREYSGNWSRQQKAIQDIVERHIMW